ncbi:hypothetical protein BVI2075_430079 [Burkholderia vietnamiensis]|nr:hypothetical protein BVI2075_430079 [Burkholderia vietnamiensis]
MDIGRSAEPGIRMRSSNSSNRLARFANRKDAARLGDATFHSSGNRHVRTGREFPPSRLALHASRPRAVARPHSATRAAFRRGGERRVRARQRRAIAHIPIPQRTRHALERRGRSHRRAANRFRPSAHAVARAPNAVPARGTSVSELTAMETASYLNDPDTLRSSPLAAPQGLRLPATSSLPKKDSR